MSNFIESFTTSDSFMITFPEELRNSVWSHSWGVIQKKLRSLPNEVVNVLIGAQKLTWVDPFPILSLIISLAELHKHKHICFIVADRSSMSSDQKRVLEFLEKEGFLEAMMSYGVAIIEESSYQDFMAGKDLHDLSTALVQWVQDYLNGYVCFSNSTILKAKVFDLANVSVQDGIDIMVDEELERIKHKIIPFVPETLLVEILWKMSFFLKETINNVNEHAYENSKEKYVGYYMRYRVGLGDNSMDTGARMKIDRLFKKEKDDLPCYVTNYPKWVTRFFEIYVIDSGVGLTSHYTSRRPEIRKSFREAWRETIGLGKRLPNVNKPTNYGGLYTLGRLLDNEYLIARDYDFWIGDVLPINAINGSYYAASSGGSDRFVEGLALMCRIAIKNPTDTNGWILSEESGKCLEDAMRERKSVYEKYYNSTYSCLPHPLSYIKDNRFCLDFMFDQHYLEQKNDVDFCVFLPSDHISKNKIFEYIEELKSLVSIGSGSRAVIIADIPVGECGLYQYALERAKFKKDFVTYVDRIVLISQRLSVCVLVLEESDSGKTYVYSKECTRQYIHSRPSDFSPHLSLFHSLEWMKTHDSMLVWQYIRKKNESESFFVNKDVTWYKENDNNEKTLNGYLDFEKTLTDSFLKSVYQNALIRTLALGNDKRCEYIAEDPLMTGLSDFLSTLYYNASRDPGNKKIALGSVYVSGSTQSVGVTHNINLFLHKDFILYDNHNPVMHLLAWPEKELFSFENSPSDPITYPYRRVGATYAIAPYGWRYFPIPRYKAMDSDGNRKIGVNYFLRKEEAGRIEFKSVYKCPPKETYGYWQGQNGVFLGISHVDYYTKHDILNINFPFIVKEGFLLGNNLACFLLGEIVAAMGLKKSDLRFDETDKFLTDVMEYASKNNDKYKEKRCSILVYPYHSNTERVIDIVKKYIVDNRVVMVPLIPINKERNGTCFQPSPLTIEMLKKAITSLSVKGGTSKDVNVLLFDDAVVDGKTQEEIKHILYSLGVNLVVSMFILERRRMPFNTSDESKTSVFWRLDIPRLGSKYSCPLCTALNSISDFKEQLISEVAKSRIEEWKNAWGARKENTSERIQAITPVKIHLDQPKKRFGIYFEDGVCKQCGGDANKIELFTSLGLTLYMGELLSITSRDDKMLQYCSEKYNLDSHVILEMLCTNLLLYGNTISRKVREKIVIQIFNHANNITECNNHTAFAALVLMSQEEEVLLCIKDIYDSMIRSNKHPNFDMMIMISYLGVRYPAVFSNYEEPKKLRQISLSKYDAYCLFHSELYNGNGRTHNRPFCKLIEDTIYSNQDLTRVSNAMDCMIYALENVYDWNLTDWNSGEDVTKEQAIKRINEKKALLLDKDWDDFLNEKESIIIEMKELFGILKNIHNRLFVPLNLINKSVYAQYKDKFVLQERIIDLAKEKGYDIGFYKFDRLTVSEPHIYERWIVWDNYIEEEIKYLLDNANTHSEEKISLEDYPDSPKHKVWLQVEYDMDKQEMFLSMFNKCKALKAKEISKETRKKTRFGITHLKEEMKVKVEYVDCENHIIQTRITFKLI